MSFETRSDGILRLTKVGLWFVIFLAVLALAAANTGNNGLFLVLAMMVGILAVSHVLAGRNVRGLEVALAARGEVFARRPTRFEAAVANRGWLPRWLLMLTLEAQDVEPPAKASRPWSTPLFVPYLERGRRLRAPIETTLSRRGRHRIRRAHVTSLFPLGLYRRGRRFPVDLEVLVYPEILPRAPHPPEQLGKAGERPRRRAGWGHDLLGLREYRHGDDPRDIHWKQTARTGTLISRQREAEENRRLLIVLDNASGKLDRQDARRFERLVSEAATAALDYLERGFEVALQTREGSLPFAAGPRQRRAILESLALVELRDQPAAPLLPAAGTAHLHLALAGEPAVA